MAITSIVARAQDSSKFARAAVPVSTPLDADHNAGLDAAWSIAADCAGRSRAVVVKQMTRSCTDDIRNDN
jgi:hypothetical protein